MSDERHRREHGDLAQRTGSRFGHRAERRADHPGRVLAGDHEHAEHADRELREADADEGDVERVAVGPLVRRSCGASGVR